MKILPYENYANWDYANWAKIGIKDKSIVKIISMVRSSDELIEDLMDVLPVDLVTEIRLDKRICSIIGLDKSLYSVRGQILESVAAKHKRFQYYMQGPFVDKP